jgi:hypothetical protein
MFRGVNSLPSHLVYPRQWLYGFIYMWLSPANFGY